MAPEWVSSFVLLGFQMQTFRSGNQLPHIQQMTSAKFRTRMFLADESQIEAYSTIIVFLKESNYPRTFHHLEQN